jgi:hypothetical protein
MIAEEEFLGWLDHPVTKQLREWAHRRREDLKEQWANGTFSAAFDTEMAVKNAGATGFCSAMQELIDIDYDTLHGVIDNE